MSVSTALSVVGVTNGIWGNVEGGVDWTSDQATYPKDLELLEAEETKIETQAARFYCAGDFDIYDTVFVATGKWATTEVDGESVTAFIDVHLELHSSIHTFGSLSFRAVASDVVRGSKDDPRIVFQCYGEFDPLGYGVSGFSVEIEVDSWGQVTMTDSKITQGWGDLYATGAEGFCLHVHSDVVDETVARIGLDHDTVNEAAHAVNDAASDAYDYVSDTVSDWFSDDNSDQVDEESSSSWWS